MAGSPPAQRNASVHRRYLAFCSEVGLDQAAARLDPDLIEAFVITGLRGRQSSTKGTYRSVLSRMVSNEGRPAGRGTPLSGSPASVPYLPEERSDLVAMALAQRREPARRSALCVLAAGVGAGLSGAELVGLRGPQVVLADGRAEVTVTGRRPRKVPVRSSFGSVLLTLAGQAGDGFVFHPGPADRTYKNFVNNFCRHLVRDPALPALSAGRARASFVCDHLARRTPLSEILAVTGIVEVESLARYARWVPGVSASKADLRRSWVGEVR